MDSLKVKSGDLVIVKPYSCVNPIWGSSKSTDFTYSPELGLIIKEKLDYYYIKTESRLGWTHKDSLENLNETR